MTFAPYTKPDGTQDEFFVDDKLAVGLGKWKEFVEKKDFDQVILIDGAEGCGKSVLGMQMGKALDPTLNLDRVCMNPTEFIKAVQTAEKGQVVIYDEAYTGLAARQSLSEINHLIVSMMMEMRQKNLIVIIILPTFFMLDRYVAIHRSRALFHVYTNKGRRGYWSYYSNKNKKLLYLIGRKLMSYNKPTIKTKGRFYGKYVLDENKYRAKKDYALKNREVKKTDDELAEKLEKYIVIISYLLKKTKIGSLRKQGEWLKAHECIIDRARLSALTKKYAEFYESLAG